MQYSIRNNNFSDFSVISKNKLAPRSYFIPLKNKQEKKDVPLLRKRYSSSLVGCLSGEWDFIYYDNPGNLPDTINTAELSFDKLDVPSVWQYRGYGKPCYLNSRYPFKYNPPFIPEYESVSDYYSTTDGFIKAPADEFNHVVY